MARFSERFRRDKSVGTIGPGKPPAPGSLLALDPDEDEAEPETASPSRPIDDEFRDPLVAAPNHAHPTPLLAALTGQADAQPRPFMRMRRKLSKDDTILDARPKAVRQPAGALRLGLDRLIARARGVEGDVESIPEARMDGATSPGFADTPHSAPPAAGKLDDAEKRLSIALSKTGWLASEIARCSAVLEETRGLIHAEELRLARMRGVEEGQGTPSAELDDDAADIQRGLSELREILENIKKS